MSNVIDFLRSKLFDYQLEALFAWLTYFDDNDGNPLICLPTATGKSYVNAAIVLYVLATYPNQRILCLTHVKNLIEQNLEKVLQLWPNAPYGVYSAGLNQRSTAHSLIFGGIASVVKNLALFGRFDLIIIDECFSADTEILTEKGFIRFDELKDEQVAQYSVFGTKIEFVTPLRKINKKPTSKVIEVESDNNYSLCLTENHEMLVTSATGNWIKRAAKDVKKGNLYKMTTGGLGSGNEIELSCFEKFVIAFQADGSFHDHYGKSVTASFSFSKERKINEFLKLMEEGSFHYTEVAGHKGSGNVKYRRRFLVHIEKSSNISKNVSSFFDLKKLSFIKAKAIIEYMNIWDGHVVTKDLYLYTNTNKQSADFYQAVAVLCGYKTKLSVVVDDRSETFSDCYRLSIVKSNSEISTQSWKPKDSSYKGNVYCVEVPSGYIITRRNGKVLITGNCHLVSLKDDAMYNQVIAHFTALNPYLKVTGLTATDYRMQQGRLTEGKGALFTDVCFNLTGRDSFCRFIAEGRLAPLVPKETRIEVDTSNIKIMNGDFAKTQLDNEVEKILFAAIQETVEKAQDRHCWLVFCSGIKTSEHAAEMLNSFGIAAAAIHSKLTDEECDKRFAAFKRGELRAICGNNKFTTGFDFPPIDLIVMLRSTMSPGLWVQMLGRGTRVYDFRNPQQYKVGFNYVKTNTLVLDFAGNCRRLGPINDPVIPKKKGDKTGDAPIKICEHVENGIKCGIYNHASARYCGGKPYASEEGCGAEFTFKTKLTRTAGTDELIAGEAQVIETVPVTRVIYNRHIKIGSAPSIKVSYYNGLKRYCEWVTLEAKGYAKNRAVSWWRQRHSAEPPSTTDEALLYISQLRVPTKIRVMKKGEYFEVLGPEWD